MKIYIMVDNEGNSGVYCSEQVTNGSPLKQEGREYMTADVNACADACKEAGCEVFVRDAHGALIWDKLSASVDACAMGKLGQNRMPGLDGCDGVILLGYHAMAGTAEAILEHTFNSKRVQNYYINGEVVGELACDAAFCGEKGVPVIMASGDDKLCAECRHFLPWAATAQVKTGFTAQGGILLSPAAAYAEIRRATLEAIENFSRMKLYTVKTPLLFRVEGMERIEMPNPFERPYVRIINGRTYEFNADTVEEALFRRL